MGEKVLIASPIKQEPEILKEFLAALNRLDITGLEVDYYFIDDNIDPVSVKLLKEFTPKGGGEVFRKAIFSGDDYNKDQQAHYWDGELIKKIAEFKDHILDYAAQRGYHLLLVDSDLILHPSTLQQLLATEKNIISEIFWTLWKQESKIALPQVWLHGEYNLYPAGPGEEVTEDEIDYRMANWLNRLKQPGIYQVGGLGAVTLIRQEALKTELSFQPLQNIDFAGEDRHFCIRAIALGFDLYVDTHYPAYHIYRQQDLDKVDDYLKQIEFQEPNLKTKHWKQERIAPTRQREKNQQVNNLTLAMLVRNEAGRYLEEVLEQAVNYIDQAVILDDASTDDTVSLCKDILGDKLTLLESNEESNFEQEYKLRKQLWELTVATDPDWILCLDADELFEDRAVQQIRELLNTERWDHYAFRLYDFWDQNHYREDEYWQAHKSYRTLLVRYQDNFEYKWKKKKLHSSRFPSNVWATPGTISELRIKHFGWATEKDRKKKYERYKRLDPNGKYGNQAQYESILDSRPRLIEWQE